MNWLRFAVAVLIAGMAISLTDWLFFGVLFHEKYQTYPEVWRASQSVNRPIWIVLGFFTSAVFIYACAHLNFYSVGAAFKLVLLIWLAAVVPIIATNALFMKLDPLVVVAHCLGWFARLGIAAACMTIVRRR